jgi:hypothetical protein
LVEQRYRKPQVRGSTPLPGSDVSTPHLQPFQKNVQLECMTDATSTSRFWLGTAVTVLIAAAIPLTLLAVRNQQDISSSAAAACDQAPVNVQFRLNTAIKTDKPWKEGKDINANVGDTLEVNCFAEGGAALLDGGQITGKIGGKVIDLEGSSSFFDGTQVRGYVLSKTGNYSFECKKSDGSCSNTDTFVTDVRVATPSPVSSPTSSASPGVTPTPGNCTTFASSDLNHDCSSTIQDYDIFLHDFVDQQE